MAEKQSQIKPGKRIFLVTSYFAFACGLLIFGLLCGMIAHEESHAVVCLFFGFPISYFSITHVVYSYPVSASSFSVLAVLLAGGIGQVLFSLLFFWALTKFERNAVLAPIVVNTKKHSAKLGLIFGSEIAVLSIAFHGVANAIWEGFLNQNYQKNHNDVTASAFIISVCIVISVVLIIRRNKYFKKISSNSGFD